MNNQLVQFKGDNEDLFVKLDVDHLKAGAEIVVPETHFALMIKDGVCVEALSAGRYDLFDTKHGLFREVKAKDEHVEVIYISKTVRVRMKWGTPTHLSLRDPVTDVPVKLGLSGELEFKVKSPKKFYLEIVGADEKYDVNNLKERVLARFVGIIESSVLEVMRGEGVSYTDLDTEKARISESLRFKLSEFFENEYGLTLYSFSILNHVIPPESVMAIERARLAMKDKGDLDAVCVACGKKIPSGAAFCPSCGANQNERRCRKCGAIMPADAKFCYECGARLKD